MENIPFFISLKVHFWYIKATVLYYFCNNSFDNIIMHMECRLSFTSSCLIP